MSPRLNDGVHSATSSEVKNKIHALRRDGPRREDGVTSRGDWFCLVGERKRR